MDEDLVLLGDRIAETAAHLDAALHRLLTDLREFDQKGGYYKVGAKTCAHWMSWRVGWDLGTAREHVRVARALGSLPLIDEALRLGRCSYSKVRAMTRVATAKNERLLLCDALLITGQQLEKVCQKYRMVQRYCEVNKPEDDEVRRYVRRRTQADGMVRIEAVLHPDEAAIVWAALDRAAKDMARGVSPEDLRSESSLTGEFDSKDVPAGTSGLLLAPGDEPARPTHLPLMQSEINGGDDFTRPRADASDCEDNEKGLAPIQESLAWEPHRLGSHAGWRSSASVIREDRASTDVAVADDHDFEDEMGPFMPQAVAEMRAREQRLKELAAERPKFNRADALVNIMQRFACGTAQDCNPIEVIVTIPASALKEGVAPSVENIGCLPDGDCIHGDTGRRLACDAGIVWMVEDEQGQALSVGRRTRAIPAAIKRALIKRDRTCRFPGCDNRLYVEGHHVVHWADGGDTALSNLVILCSHHHRYLHEYKYRIEFEATSGEPMFFDPRGRRVEEVPAPITHLHLGWDAIANANRDLEITAETNEPGWDGSPVPFNDLVGYLSEVDNDHRALDSYYEDSLLVLGAIARRR
ncbi:MAG: putative His-Me finger endonuclease domain protein [Myxococcales bacterium]|nr:putative His-Me finger endonuclease domain protein [Myxococcales bacterium]